MKFEEFRQTHKLLKQYKYTWAPIEKGYNNWTYILTSPTYDTVRASDCFIEIMRNKKPQDSTHRPPRHHSKYRPGE